MRLCPRVPGGLLVALALCLGGTSCTPTVPGESELFALEGYPDLGNEHFSKRQILRFANRVARRHGYNLRKCGIQYDEGNEYWKERYPEPPAELEGCDYQVVWYREEEIVFDGELVVIVDRDTGQVLMEL